MLSHITEAVDKLVDVFSNEIEKSALRKNTERIDFLMKKLREIAKKDGWKPMEKSVAIKTLAKEEILDENFILDIFSALIWEGTLYEPIKNYISFANKERLTEQ